MNIIRVQPTINGVNKVKNNTAVIGTTAFVTNLGQGSSASRLMMAAVQAQQLLGPRGAEPRLFLSGGETEMAKYNFDDIIPCNCYIEAKIPHYPSLYSKDVPFTLIYREEATGKFDFIDVTPYIENHIKFTHRKEFLPLAGKLEPGMFLPKGTRLTKTSNIHDGDIHSNTVNAMTLYISSPETTEDGFGIRKGFVEKLMPKAYGTSTASYGLTTFPIYIYGTENKKRHFPAQGESLRADGMISCIREYDEMWDWLFTHEALLDKPDRIFDVCMHGEPNAKVYEVDVLTTNEENKKPVTNPDISKSLEPYYLRKVQYAKKMISFYSKIKSESNARIALPLYRKFADMLAIAPNSSDLKSVLPESEQRILASRARNKKSVKYIRTVKNATLDEWTVTIKYSWEYNLHKGAKLANLYGGKGVICKFIDDDKMYTDDLGNVADITIFTKAVSARMNNDQMYEHYMSGYVLAVKRKCVKLMEKSKWEEAFDHTLRMYQILSPNITYPNALRIYKTLDDKIEHLKLIYSGDNLPRCTVPGDADYIHEGLYDQILDHIPPEFSRIRYVNERGEIEYLKKKGLIAPTAIGILEKTQHNNLAESTAQQQHHGLPTSTSNKGEHASGYKQHSPKIFSETETRLMSNVVGSIVTAQIMDQATNSTSSQMSAETMFTSTIPGGERVYVDRNIQPMGEGSPQAMIRHSFENEGTEISGIDAKSLDASIKWSSRYKD